MSNSSDICSVYNRSPEDAKKVLEVPGVAVSWGSRQVCIKGEVKGDIDQLARAVLAKPADQIVNADIEVATLLNRLYFSEPPITDKELVAAPSSVIGLSVAPLPEAPEKIKETMRYQLQMFIATAFNKENDVSIQNQAVRVPNSGFMAKVWNRGKALIAERQKRPEIQRSQATYNREFIEEKAKGLENRGKFFSLIEQGPIITDSPGEAESKKWFGEISSNTIRIAEKETALLKKDGAPLKVREEYWDTAQRSLNKTLRSFGTSRAEYSTLSDAVRSKYTFEEIETNAKVIISSEEGGDVTEEALAMANNFLAELFLMDLLEKLGPTRQGCIENVLICLEQAFSLELVKESFKFVLPLPKLLPVKIEIKTPKESENLVVTLSIESSKTYCNEDGNKEEYPCAIRGSLTVNVSPDPIKGVVSYAFNTEKLETPSEVSPNLSIICGVVGN